MSDIKVHSFTVHSEIFIQWFQADIEHFISSEKGTLSFDIKNFGEL